MRFSRRLAAFPNSQESFAENSGQTRLGGLHGIT